MRSQQHFLKLNFGATLKHVQPFSQLQIVNESIHYVIFHDSKKSSFKSEYNLQQIFFFCLVNYKSTDLCCFLRRNFMIQHHHDISYNNFLFHGALIALITKVGLQPIIMLPFGWANGCWAKGSLGTNQCCAFKPQTLFLS